MAIKKRHKWSDNDRKIEAVCEKCGCIRHTYSLTPTYSIEKLGILRVNKAPNCI